MEVDSTECDKRLDFLQIDSLIVRLAYLNQVALHASKAASSAVVITGRRALPRVSLRDLCIRHDESSLCKYYCS